VAIVEQAEVIQPSATAQGETVLKQAEVIQPSATAQEGATRSILAVFQDIVEKFDQKYDSLKLLPHFLLLIISIVYLHYESDQNDHASYSNSTNPEEIFG
jgi:hypothetical protein